MHQLFQKKKLFFISRPVFFAGEFQQQQEAVAKKYEELKKGEETTLLTPQEGKSVDDLAKDAAERITAGLDAHKTAAFADIDKRNPPTPEGGLNPEKDAITKKYDECIKLLGEQKENFKEVANYAGEKAKVQAACKDTLADNLAVTDANLPALIAQLAQLKAFKDSKLTNPSILADRIAMGLDVKVPKIEQKMKDSLTQNTADLVKRGTEVPSTLSLLEGLKAEKTRLEGLSKNPDIAAFADISGQIAILEASITDCTKNLGKLDKETLANLELAKAQDKSPNHGWEAGANEKYKMVVAKGDAEAAKNDGLAAWKQITDGKDTSAIQTDLRAKYDQKWKDAEALVKTAEGTTDFIASSKKYADAKTAFAEIGKAYKDALANQTQATEKNDWQAKANQARVDASAVWSKLPEGWKVSGASESATWSNKEGKAANEAADLHFKAAELAYAAGNFETSANEYKLAQAEYGKIAVEANPEMKAANKAKEEAYFAWEALPAGWKANNASESKEWKNEGAKTANVNADVHWRAAEFAYSEGNYKLAEGEYRAAQVEYGKIEAEAAKEIPELAAKRVERAQTDLSGKLQYELSKIVIDGQSDADQFKTVFDTLVANLGSTKYDGVAAFSAFGHDRQGHVFEVKWNGTGMEVIKPDKARMEVAANEQSKVNEGSPDAQAAKGAVRAKLVAGIENGENWSGAASNFDTIKSNIKGFVGDALKGGYTGEQFSVYAPDKWGSTWEVKVTGGTPPNVEIYKMAAPSGIEGSLRGPAKAAPVAPPAVADVAPQAPANASDSVAAAPVVDTAATDTIASGTETKENTQATVMADLEAALVRSGKATDGVVDIKVTIAGVPVTVSRNKVGDMTYDAFEVNNAGGLISNTKEAVAAQILELSKKQGVKVAAGSKDVNSSGG